MSTAYNTMKDADELFRDADEKYVALKEELVGTGLADATHSDVEKLLETRGRDVIRALFQSHLTLRSQSAPVTPVVGDDEIKRSHRRESSRPLTSIFGPVTVQRTAYRMREANSRFPLDAELNLPGAQYSLEVRRRVALGASSGSFDATVELLQETTGASVPKRQTEELVARAAQDFEAFYESTQLDVPAESIAGILALTFDMKGIVMHKEDLRPATRKAAERKQHKPGERLGPGEKRNRKRMAMVAAVYTIEPWLRKPDDLVRTLGPVRDASPKARPKPKRKRVWASIVTDPINVIRDAFDEALCRDPQLRKRWVVLVDGDPKQIRYIQAVAKELNVEVTIILDVIHVTEYLWKAAYVFHKVGSPEAQKWVSKRLLQILRGEASLIAGGMRPSATRRKLSTTKRKSVDKCAAYLLKLKYHVRYHEFLRDGLPIGTGVIEGACRHLVRDRMDITGARWRLKSAEAVLKIRALSSSGDFDEYWAFHEQQEFTRNHASRYANSMPPKLTRPSDRAHLRLVR